MNDLLKLTLEVAVPLWIERYRGQSFERLKERAGECSQVIAEHGDDILYRGKHTATAFNRLAEALAILSFPPGGVRFAGMFFQAEREEISG